MLDFSYEGKLYTPQESKPANMIVKFPLSEPYRNMWLQNVTIIPCYRPHRLSELCCPRHWLRQLRPDLHLSGCQPLPALHPPEVLLPAPQEPWGWQLAHISSDEGAPGQSGEPPVNNMGCLTDNSVRWMTPATTLMWSPTRTAATTLTRASTSTWTRSSTERSRRRWHRMSMTPYTGITRQMRRSCQLSRSLELDEWC